MYYYASSLCALSSCIMHCNMCCTVILCTVLCLHCCTVFVSCIHLYLIWSGTMCERRVLSIRMGRRLHIVGASHHQGETKTITPSYIILITLQYVKVHPRISSWLHYNTLYYTLIYHPHYITIHYTLIYHPAAQRPNIAIPWNISP